MTRNLLKYISTRLGNRLSYSLISQKRALQARIKRNYANLACDAGNYQEALDLYNESLTIFDEIGDEEHSGITHLQMAQAMIDGQLDLEAAREHLYTVNSIAVRIGWLGGYTAGSLNLGRLYYKFAEMATDRLEALNFLQKAEGYLIDCKEALKRTDKLDWIGRAEETMGMVIRLRQKLESSKK